MLKKKLIILKIFFILQNIIINCDVQHENHQEYDFDEDSLDMFPKLKPKQPDHGNIIDITKINKTEFCDDHCKYLIESNENQICSKYIPDSKKNPIEENEIKKPVFTADGVYFYYKNFVNKFLEIINYKELIGDSHNLKLKIDLRKYQLDKLILFIQYDTTIANSSIQDVTHILKTIIYDYEIFEPESRIHIIADNLQNYLGLDLSSLLIGILIVGVLIFLIIISIKNNLHKKMNLRQIIMIFILFLIIFSTINNYYLLKQKKEIYKRAHLATKIPDECLNDGSVKKEEKNGFINYFNSFFKYSPTSRICLDYAEAVLIDTVYQVSIFEALTMTITQPVSQIFHAVGQSVNTFYQTIGKDLNFIDRSIVTVIGSIFVFSILFLMLFFLCCTEFNIFGGLISAKRKIEVQPPALPPIDEIRQQILYDIHQKLAIKLNERNLIKMNAIENVTVDVLVENIDNSIKKVINKASSAILAIQSKEENIEKIDKNGQSVTNNMKKSTSSDSLIVVDDPLDDNDDDDDMNHEENFIENVHHN